MEKLLINPILVTGAGGFIGSALIKKLLKENKAVLGVDSLNNYYDINLKKSRLENISKYAVENSSDWKFFEKDLSDFSSIEEIFNEYHPSIVINLAAQAGVRYSLSHPEEYIKSNIVGFSNIIELSKNFEIKNFIYASSSSVYGINSKSSFKETNNTDHPLSIYAATKRSNELIAHSYSHLFGLPCTGLRFFTVYGPWGRPDMAPMIFAKKIFDGEPIEVFNNGQMKRDFTFIDDVVNVIYKFCYKPSTPNQFFDISKTEPNSSTAPFRIFNIGNNSSIELEEFIGILEETIGIKAIKNYMPMQKGDVISTCANLENLEKWIGITPGTSIKEGISIFIKWYKKYYGK